MSGKPVDMYTRVYYNVINFIPRPVLTSSRALPETQ